MLIWYGDKITKTIEHKAPAIIRRICEIIAQKARSIVPVKTGKLQRSIKATDAGIEVTEPYAEKVEKGTAHSAAQPFMMPAVEQFNKEDLKKCI